MSPPKKRCPSRRRPRTESEAVALTARGLDPRLPVDGEDDLVRPYPILPRAGGEGNRLCFIFVPLLQAPNGLVGGQPADRVARDGGPLRSFWWRPGGRSGRARGRRARACPRRRGPLRQAALEQHAFGGDTPPVPASPYKVPRYRRPRSVHAPRRGRSSEIRSPRRPSSRHSPPSRMRPSESAAKRRSSVRKRARTASPARGRRPPPRWAALAPVDPRLRVAPAVGGEWPGAGAQEPDVGIGRVGRHGPRRVPVARRRPGASSRRRRRSKPIHPLPPRTRGPAPAGATRASGRRAAPRPVVLPALAAVGRAHEAAELDPD